MSKGPWIEYETRNRIRYELKHTMRTGAQIAEQFDVSIGTVNKIRRQMLEIVPRPMPAVPPAYPDVCHLLMRGKA